MKEHYLNVSIKAPYCTLNELTDETEYVWLAFHGYGQLSRYFIQKFTSLDPKKHFIIAPQGLSKYYLQGFYGRVGASWMTKEDRLTEIENQYTYIHQVLGNIGDITGKKLIYFGFSQGVATMGRFAATAAKPFDKMVLWAGTFPPDIARGAFDYLTGREEIQYFTSREDPFFKEEMIENQKKVVVETTGITPKLNWYNGGHKVIPELLDQILL